MTDPRPEREGRSYEPDGAQRPYGPQQSYGPQEPQGSPDPYGYPDAFEAAVEQLDDPLNDPLPGQVAPPAPAPAPYGQPGRGRRRGKAAQEGGGQGSPWFRPHLEPERPSRADGQGHGAETAPYGQEAGPGYAARPAATDSISRPYAPPETPVPPAPAPAPAARPGPAVSSTPAARPATAAAPPWQGDNETMALRQAEKPGAGSVSRETDTAVSRETETSASTVASTPASGGRAARRKAAQEAAKRGGRRGRHSGAAAATSAAATASEAAPAAMSRLEARQAARAAKDSPSLIASRALGEVFITLGVLMLLFVTYQLWWTNVRAEEEAGGAATNLQHEWDKGGGEKKNLADGERFGIMYIPKLDVKAPIAEGIDKHRVLDHGMVGHYDKSSGIKTAMPWDKKGNFAVAAHRNTHGEPFRYVNKLTKGDKIIVETKSSYYTYEMESILPQTSPSNTSVIGPVPPGSGFTGPGRYITLTTCTPEFTSTYRMIVWGKMVDERPRSKGKPDALAG
ncbi:MULTISPECIES: class E sortase [unclassified Streptomyces]|uniref:class E sortase n=1 Tax=unclassified Streptomyces TaxID=2593676 RepID=UPI00087E9F65|nr:MULTISPECIES: class E sortase [unclassified Streptomyces]PBC83625.1 sortase A [Streptomyces sp. 2321.6]SDR40599.1 sortase A [Streptomyces sp. KS_16]SED02682.1 sortase A [Streptomyces sp. 2133.1]SNC69703.1 sortase A [Streptomyces sp. 2114.4]